jgi:phage shock protein A
MALPLQRAESAAEIADLVKSARFAVQNPQCLHSPLIYRELLAGLLERIQQLEFQVASNHHNAVVMRKSLSFYQEEKL